MIDGARLLADLRELARIGAYRTGVHRPTYSADDMQSRHWLMQRLRAAGLEPELDGIGNVIGRSSAPGPRLLIGSHLETQNHAGWLDGAMGVVYGLEDKKLRIGVVTEIVGSRTHQIAFEGQQNHAGTTRMEVRRDAGVALVRLAAAIEREFPGLAGERTVWTCGKITLEPGAPSIIPGRAEMLFQFRDTDLSRMDRLSDKLAELVAGEDTGPCRVQMSRTAATVPQAMDHGFAQALERAARRHAPALHQRMPSGAGHDAQILASQMPAAMLFVPSIGGVSHHFTEDTSEADVVLGCAVFADAAHDILACSG